jgi:hypothetical protein
VSNRDVQGRKQIKRGRPKLRPRTVHRPRARARPGIDDAQHLGHGREKQPPAKQPQHHDVLQVLAVLLAVVVGDGVVGGVVTGGGSGGRRGEGGRVRHVAPPVLKDVPDARRGEGRGGARTEGGGFVAVVGVIVVIVVVVGGGGGGDEGGGAR